MIQNLSIEKLMQLTGLVQRCFPDTTAICAGGALRDLLHDKPVKDIDIFIAFREGLADDKMSAIWFDGIHDLGKELHCEPEFDGDQLDLRNEKGYSYGAFALVDYPTGLHMHSVQLVFIEEHPIDNVEKHFDFGLSKVWCTETKFKRTRDFIKDHDLHRITYLQSCEPNHQRRVSSKHRLARLQEKYLGWDFRRTYLLDEVELPLAKAVVEPTRTQTHGYYGKGDRRAYGVPA